MRRIGLLLTMSLLVAFLGTVRVSAEELPERIVGCMEVESNVIAKVGINCAILNISTFEPLSYFSTFAKKAEQRELEYTSYPGSKEECVDVIKLSLGQKIEPLHLSEWMPYAGYWVMAVGTADGFEGSVAFGNVLNTTDTDVLITAAISHGNSGGPLVDNEGNVVGTNTWGAEGEQYNGAVSLDAMCVKIMKCDGKYYWSRD